MDAQDLAQAKPAKLDKAVQKGSDEATKATGLRSERSRWRRAFLKAFAKDGNLTRACGLAGVNRVTVYKTRKKSPRFNEAYKRAAADARRRTADSFERLLHHRARHGTKKAIVANGEIIAYERRHDSRLLLKVLEAENPKKYGKRQESTAQVNVLVTHATQARLLDDPAVAQLACDLAAKLAAPQKALAQTPEIEV